MSKAFKEIGFRKSMRFLTCEIALCVFKMIIVPQVRAIFLRFLGADIGKDVIIFEAKFQNCYRKGFKGLHIGDNCFIGSDCLFDLADSITIGNNVTIASSVNIVTHLNVGYKDHPLQKFFPAMSKGVIIKDNVFLGFNSTVLAGVTIHERSFVAASALVCEDVASNTVVAGVPAKEIRKI